LCLAIYFSSTEKLLLFLPSYLSGRVIAKFYFQINKRKFALKGYSLCQDGEKILEIHKKWGVRTYVMVVPLIEVK